MLLNSIIQDVENLKEKTNTLEKHRSVSLSNEQNAHDRRSISRTADYDRDLEVGEETRLIDVAERIVEEDTPSKSDKDGAKSRLAAISEVTVGIVGVLSIIGMAAVTAYGLYIRDEKAILGVGAGAVLGSGLGVVAAISRIKDALKRRKESNNSTGEGEVAVLDLTKFVSNRTSATRKSSVSDSQHSNRISNSMIEMCQIDTKIAL